MFKVVVTYPDGESDEQDETFETEAEAEEYGWQCVSEWGQGGEVLHLSNPGDYPLYDGPDLSDVEVIEV
jgi:hypothetical protein